MQIVAGTRRAPLNPYPGGSMAEHTHEFDCIICGAHFDSESALHKHDDEKHGAPRVAASSTPAEPIGNEHKTRFNEGQRSPKE
jgi:hypothetical protein